MGGGLSWYVLSIGRGGGGSGRSRHGHEPVQGFRGLGVGRHGRQLILPQVEETACQVLQIRGIRHGPEYKRKNNAMQHFPENSDKVASMNNLIVGPGSRKTGWENASHGQK